MLSSVRSSPQAARTPLAAAAVVLLATTAVACGDGYDATADQPGDGIEAVQGAAFVDTKQLPLPPFGSHFTTYTMCWDASAFKTGSLQALFDAGRAAVQQEITDTWDKNSWVNFVWRANCNSGGIPIKISDVTPNASRVQVTLNFTFNNYRKAECAPTGGTAVNAAWTKCLKKNAVHEFGHTLGFDHEQNRGIGGQQCGAGDAPELDVPGSSIVGDLPIGTADANSVMSYCWNNRTIDLTASDVEAVRAIYGDEGRSVRDNLLYAVREAVQFMDLNSSSRKITTQRIQRAFRVRGPSANAGIRYGDKISIMTGNLKLCATLGGASRFGTFPPELVFTDAPYDPAACLWEVRHDSSGDGGTTVNINDSVVLFLNAPVPPQNPNNPVIAFGFNGSLGVHFLGAFAPL